MEIDYAKEFFLAVEAACRMPETGHKGKIVSALADALVLISYPAMEYKGHETTQNGPLSGLISRLGTDIHRS